jgi:ribose 5-phosphate isomerase A
MNLKLKAARRALDFVSNGMTIGLGSGSTTSHFIELLANQLEAGSLHHIQGVPTSTAIMEKARSLGIPLTSLAKHSSIDIAVDGADEVDPNLDLIKGLGKALLREKIVAIHSEKFVIIVDESKIVPRLGTKGPLPVEVVRFEIDAHIRWLNTICSFAELWTEKDNKPTITDNGNFLVRCWFNDGIAGSHDLSLALNQRPGIVEHGLFLDQADIVVVARQHDIKILNR